MKSAIVAYLTEGRTSSKYFNEILFLKKWLLFLFCKAFSPKLDSLYLYFIQTSLRNNFKFITW